VSDRLIAAKNVELVERKNGEQKLLTCEQLLAKLV